MDIQHALRISALIFIPLWLLGCSDEATVAEKPVRPVMSVIAGASGSDFRKSFPGKINAAEQVDLAFQVPGRLIEMPIKK